MTFRGTLAGIDLSTTFQIVVAVCAFIGAAVLSLLKRRARRSEGGVTPAAPFKYPTHPVIMPPEGAATSRSMGQIESVRALLSSPPRTFPRELRSYLTFEAPVWLKGRPDDDGWLDVRHQDRVRRDGQVVWATTVQANHNLFQRNNVESGASVIYSPDLWFDRNRETLRHIAMQCYALKGTDPADPESAAFARMITNEMTRGMRMKVPSVFMRGRQVFHSTMLMPRKHLPKGYLSGTHFPIWMDPQETGVVILVPAAYWPASLTKEWDRDAG